MWMDLPRDLSYSLRVLRREWLFTLVSIITLGLGVGVTTTFYVVADRVLLRPVPWPDADRLVRLEERRGGQRGRTPWTVTNGIYNAWRDDARTLDGLAAWRSNGQTLRDGDPERLLVTASTPSLFAILGARPALGRLFTEDDAQIGRPAVAILSHGLWQSRFGGDRGVLGRHIQLDDRTHEIVGVMPRGFAFPDRQTRVWLPFQPLALMSADGRQMRIIVVEAIGRLRRGVTADQAAAEASGRARDVPDIRQAALSVFGSSGDVSVAVVPIHDVVTNEVRLAMIVFVIAVSLLLLASTASVVCLQLARVLAKRKERAIREAVGGNQWRLVRLWGSETALVAAGAAVAGLSVAVLLITWLPSWLPGDFPRIDDISMDLQGGLFAIGATVAMSFVCAAMPFVGGRSRPAYSDLAVDGVSQSGLVASSSASRLQWCIVVGQVAAACALLIGSSVLFRSFAALVSVDRGYEPANLLTARLSLPHEISATRRIQLLETLRERLQSSASVSAVGFGNGLPLLTAPSAYGRIIPSPIDPAVPLEVAANWRVVDPGYLQALRVRVAAGRLLGDHDLSDAPGAVVVNRAFAEQYLGPRPVGKRLALGLSKPEYEVVGVLDDVRLDAFAGPASPEFFVSYRQEPQGIAFDPVVVIRTSGDAAAFVGTLKSIVHEIDRAAALDSIMTMEDRLEHSLGRPRAYMLLLATMAGVALIIAIVGVFGLMSFITALRTHEIGVRIAVGAAPLAVAGLIVRQAAVMVAAGLILGVGVALAISRSMSSLVYGISSRDPMSFALGPLTVAVLALIAAAFPAWRAGRVDPIRAIHSK